jgi:lipopolysaccharide transport system permease protein
MYATPVIYPASFFPEKWQWIFNWNPISPLIEMFRYVMLGTDRFNIMHLGYSVAFSILCFFIGLMFFSRTERNFMDTV